MKDMISEIGNLLFEFALGFFQVLKQLVVGIHAEPEKYQTIIGGGLALLGVLITLAINGGRLRRQLDHNARISERSHARELQTQKKAVRGAFLAELSVTSRFLKLEETQARKFLDPNWRTLDEIRDETNFDQGEEHSPMPIRGGDEELNYRFAISPRDLVYRALVPQISALAHDEIGKIISAYDRFNLFRAWLLENDILGQRKIEVHIFSPDKVNELIEELSDIRSELNLVIAQMSDVEN